MTAFRLTNKPNFTEAEISHGGRNYTKKKSKGADRTEKTL